MDITTSLVVLLGIIGFFLFAGILQAVLSTDKNIYIPNDDDYPTWM
jgi:hypothetical protein